MASLAANLGRERVCCLTGVPAEEDLKAEVSGVRIYRRANAFAKATVPQSVAWGVTIAEIMLRERPTAVQLATVSEGYLGLWLQRWLNLPYLIYAHGNEILDAVNSTWPKVRLSLQKAHRVLAVSNFTAGFVEKAGVQPSKIEIVHPGCDVDFFRPLPVRSDLQQKFFGSKKYSHVILSVGNLVARKGHDMVLRALPCVREYLTNTVYLIVGDGPYRAALEELARETKVADCVVFAGRASSEDLPHIYALADVCVMPSRQLLASSDVEGFGMVYIEANACGKPVIGGRSGGIPDAVVEGVTGFLANPNEPDEIAGLLIKVLSDRNLARVLGEQGRLRAVAEFSWPKVTGRVLGILDSMSRENSTRH